MTPRSIAAVLGDKTSPTHSGTSAIGVSSRSGQPDVERRHPATSGTTREKLFSDRISGSITKSQSGGSDPLGNPKRSWRTAKSLP